MAGAAAGRANECDLSGMAAGLDLLPTTVCAGFKTLSLTSVQNLGSKNPRSMKLALDKV
jgi:hypothetical protein